MLQRNKIVLGLLLACSVLLLGACSTGEELEATIDDQLTVGKDRNIAVRTLSGSMRGALQAVQTPLVDLNITRDEIPEYLQAISGNPYRMPSPLQCTVMTDELDDLDLLLGPDMETAAAEGEKEVDYVEEGAAMVQSHAIGFVAGKASILPLRGVVRHITGASKHAKERSTAYETGKLRRAYLKGLKTALKCDKADKKQAVAAAKPKAKGEVQLSEANVK